MRSIFKAFLFFFLLSIFPAMVFSQTVEQSAKLQELSIELREKFEQERSYALKMADSLGIPVRKTFDDGRTIALVKFENGRPVYKTTYNANGAQLLNTDVVQDTAPTGFSLSGSGQVIGLWDAGNPLEDHEELDGRISIIQNKGTDEHATHVAGTLIASGVNNPTAKGMAPSASIDSYEFLTDQVNMLIAADNGLLVSVHPYGYQVGWVQDNAVESPVGQGWYWRGSASWEEDHNFGLYDEDNARGWDEIAYNAPNYLIVTSAGNDRGRGPATGDNKYEWNGSAWVLCDPGCTVEHDLNGGSNGYDTLADNSVAKNVLVVGAVDNSPAMWANSNWGPTDDGRIKPDVVAKGVGVSSTESASIDDYGSKTGTSFSAPMIAGSAALLLEHQENIHPGEKLLSSTLRGLISHTATDLGPAGPDYEFGWGLMNTRKAAEVMQSNFENNRIHIRELTINNNQSLEFQVKATGSEPLRATIAWTDPPGTPADLVTVTFNGDTYQEPALDPTDLMLVNDLDMRLTDASNTYFPFTLDPSKGNRNLPAVANTDNFRDNIEIVHIENPTPGELYTVTISHKGSTLEGGKQDFSLIITGNTGMNYNQSIAKGSSSTGEGWRFLGAPGWSRPSELLSSIWTQGAANADYPNGAPSVLEFDGSGYNAFSDLELPLHPGKGLAVYIYEDDNFDSAPDSWPKTLITTGMESIGDVDLDDLIIPVGSGEGNEVYTLLGNPFNSTIDFDLFSNQSQIGNVVYVYDHACETFSEPDKDGGTEGGCFRAWSTAGSGSGSLDQGLIAPFQGFFVYSTGSNPTLTIPVSAKTTGGTFYKEQPNQTPVMQIAARINGEYSGETWLSFTETGSIKKNSYDAPYLYPLDYRPFLSLQTRFDGTGFNIKNLPAAPKTSIEIPLVAEAWEPDQDEQSPGYRPLTGNIELIWPKMENLPSEWAVTLTDHHLGKIINMKTQGRYEYTTSPQKQAERVMPYKMELQKAVNKQTENSRFTITVSPNGESQITESNLPEAFELHQNYPNPFNPTTVIRYDLPENAEVSLDVYSVNGQRVATLVNQNQQAGSYTVPFDASRLASGIYIYQLKAGNFLTTQKMVLLK